MLTFDFKSYNCGLTNNLDKKYLTQIKSIKEQFKDKSNMKDWLDVDTMISKNEISKIKKISSKIKQNYDVLVVIGIGGSYLGTKALYELFTPYYSKPKPEIIFLGNDLDDEYLIQSINYLKNKEFFVNVVSKSGNTLEIKLAFERVLKLLKLKYKNRYVEHVVCTTSAESGQLHDFAVENAIDTLVVPENIGGRYSVLTTVGLFPLCVAGVNIDKLLKGYNEGKKYIDDALYYASIRDALYQSGKKLEGFTVYEKRLNDLGLWYQQLFAETQGKDGKAIFPFENRYTTNLHSIGQYFQEGEKIAFETILKIGKTENYNNTAINAVAKAHTLNNSPSFIICLERLDEENIGEFIYFCFICASAGGYMLKVDPFNQPGVEEYKKNLKQLINKKG